MSKVQESLFDQNSTHGDAASKPFRKPAATRMERRTYLNNLLVEESLEHLPAALEHQDTASFKAYLRDHLHQNSAKTRVKYAEYIAYRYSKDGQMNLALA